MTKKLFATVILVMVGCNHPTSFNAPQIPPFSPGGAYYVVPGTYTGMWESHNYTSDGYQSIDSVPCVAVITEADSLVVGTITNDSSKEVLTLHGVHAFPIVTCYPCSGTLPPHFYKMTDTSSFDNADTSINFGFISNGEVIEYEGMRGHPNPNYSNSSFYIYCERN